MNTCKILIDNALNKIKISHIVLLSFSIHMFVISMPNLEQIDEIFFTTFLRWFMLGIDHTPYILPGLSLIVAPFVYVFGDNYFAWRFPVIIFGTVFLFFYYKVIEHITNKNTALLTTIILALSPIIFTSSSLMLRDMPVMALGFLSIWLYFKNKYYFSALLIGLSGLIKETGIFFLFFIALYHSFTYIRKNEITIQKIFPRTATLTENLGRDKKIYLAWLKKPIIFLLIVSGVFLGTLYVYDNTITVLEYSTKHPEYLTVDENFQPKAVRFHITKTTTEILEKDVSEFNYLVQVKDPIHHLKLLFANNYSGEGVTTGKVSFTKSFIPTFGKLVGLFGETFGFSDTIIDDKGFEKHVTQFDTFWLQSLVNYSWWYFGFWSCVLLVTYSVFNRIKNKVSFSKISMFLSFGFVFFLPYLIIDMIRDTFAYYIIYFLPFMALALITTIYKIPNKKIQLTVLSVFLIAITYNFFHYFPVRFF